VALFGKKKGVVGLDIGSSAIKVVELKPGGKGGAEHQLVGLGLEPLPPEAIVDGAIMDSGSVIDAIQRLCQTQKIKTVDVATSVSGNAVIVKKISPSTGKPSSTYPSTSRTWPWTTRWWKGAGPAATWTCCWWP
jgi:Tfp pilus assembly PilM family ATPase